MQDESSPDDGSPPESSSDELPLSSISVEQTTTTPPPPPAATATNSCPIIPPPPPPTEILNTTIINNYNNDNNNTNMRDNNNHEDIPLDLPDDISNLTPTAPSSSGAPTDHGGDHGDNDIPISFSVYVFAGCAALNSANIGYDIGMNTNAGKMIQDDMELTDVQIELFMGSLNLYSMVGAVGAHYISDRFGRRRCFISAAVGFIVGCLMLAMAQNYATLVFGRILMGLGVGFGLAIDPVYISEISPASHRGMLVTWSEIAINIGLLIGFSANLILYSVPDNVAWRWMFGFGTIMPTILIVLVLCVMPESPRWLVQNNRDAEAKAVLAEIYPPGFDVDVVVRDIRENIKTDEEAEHATGWGMILFPTPAFRRILIVGIGIAAAQQAVGIDAVQYFLLYILDEAGVTTRGTQGAVLIFLGIVKLSFIIYAGSVFDRRGRKPLFYVSLGGMALSCLILAFNFFAKESNASFAVFALALYLAFFSLGMGPGAWLIPSEVFPTSIRAKAMSVATFLNRVTATMMASTFLSVTEAITWAGFFMVLATVCVVILLFVYKFVPETKGKSLEDMTVYFAEITGDESILDLVGERNAGREGTLGEEEDVLTSLSGAPLEVGDKEDGKEGVVAGEYT